MNMSPQIVVERTDRVSVVRIDHPPLNVLTLRMVSDLKSILAELEKDESVRTVVLTGSGGSPFCSGIDMGEWSRLSPKEAQAAITEGQDAMRALENLPKPTIAAIAGLARGAGAELAWACDLRIADETAVFSQPEVDFGWMPNRGATVRVPRLAGRSKALEILVTGKDVNALDALRIGLVDHLSAPGDAFVQAMRLANEFAAKSAAAVRAIKRTLTEGEQKPYRNRFLLESQHAVQLLWSDEYSEAMAKVRKERH